MNALTARRSIRSDAQTIGGIIADISRLAEWNPALLSVAADDPVARLDHPYPVRTRVPGRATLTYVQISPKRIVWRLDLVGGVETGEWDLVSDGPLTHVVHTMTHSGPLLSLMHHAMAEVPTWRLDRLQERTERRRAAPR